MPVPCGSPSESLIAMVAHPHSTSLVTYNATIIFELVGKGAECQWTEFSKVISYTYR